MAEEPKSPAENAPEESLSERLTDLTARATALYAVKKYEEAAELYSEATEIQADLNGELAEENADLLFAYGRCLYFVAQMTSTVLGGTAASAQLKGGEKKSSKKRKANGTIKAESSTSAPSTSLQSITETAEPADVVPAEDANPAETKPASSENPYFKIEGDAADWADSEDDEEEDGNNESEGEDEEEDDDFTTAFEILDMARVVYMNKLKNIPPADDALQSTRDLRVRISDIYDLQAEISLEGEKFDAAVNDLRSCLELKEKLYTPDNSILAECHYKLSLALEAASQVQERDGDGNPVGRISIDWSLRNEAVAQQDKAVQSCKLRIAEEEKQLENLPADKQAKAKEQIEDVQDMTAAMEQRLEELKKPPVSVKAEAEKDAQQELMGSVLGSLLGGSNSEQKGKLNEIIAGANDLSGIVKKKKKTIDATNGSNASTPADIASEPEVNGKGKRKLDDNGDGQDTVKKVRIEDVID